MRHVDDQAGVDVELDLDAVSRDGGNIAQRRILGLLLGIEANLLGIGLLQVGGGPHEDLARSAIGDERASGIDQIDEPFRLTHGGNARCSARATMATWLVLPPSSRITPRSLVRS